MSKRPNTLWLLLVCLLGPGQPSQAADPADEPDPWLKQRLEWFQDMKFGFMMHWGAYSQWGCIESWRTSTRRSWTTEKARSQSCERHWHWIPSYQIPTYC